MKEEYSKPEMKLISFQAEDIITTSGGCDAHSWCLWDCLSNCQAVN